MAMRRAAVRRFRTAKLCAALPVLPLPRRERQNSARSQSSRPSRRKSRSRRSLPSKPSPCIHRRHFHAKKVLRRARRLSPDRRAARRGHPHLAAGLPFSRRRLPAHPRRRTARRSVLLHGHRLLPPQRWRRAALSRPDRAALRPFHRALPSAEPLCRRHVCDRMAARPASSRAPFTTSGTFPAVPAGRTGGVLPPQAAPMAGLCAGGRALSDRPRRRQLARRGLPRARGRGVLRRPARRASPHPRADGAAVSAARRTASPRARRPSRANRPSHRALRRLLRRIAGHHGCRGPLASRARRPAPRQHDPSRFPCAPRFCF